MNITITKDKEISFIHLENPKNFKMTLCSLGASVYSIFFKEKDMILTPIHHEDFYYNDAYFGKSVGRFSGRIDEAKCSINGTSYNLAKNWNKINSLHGGDYGISFVNFTYEIDSQKDYTDVIFHYLEKENDLPGDIDYTITYRISENLSTYTIFFKAIPNKDTLINLTNHAYFTLNNTSSTILEHTLQLNCSTYGNLNNNLICESIEKVSPTMDFTTSHLLSEHIEDPYLQNHTSFGYDHFFIKANKEEPHIATLCNLKDGITLKVSTSYPSIVVYTTNYPSTFSFYPGKTIEKYQGICLECQFVPNGINMENVEKAICKKGQTYEQYITYCFE